jgi:hypothetical protein
VSFLLIGDMEKAEEFKLVDKSPFTFFGPLCNSGESAGILTKKGNNYIRLTMVGTV